MSNAYDSLYTGPHNDEYNTRITTLENYKSSSTTQIAILQASTTAIATTANSKVAKAGDTMTGNLNIKDNNITLGTTSSDNHYSPGFGFRDSHTSNIGAVRAYSLANGQQGIYIEAVQSVNGVNQYNTLRLGVNAQGDREIFINDATKPAWRKALGLEDVNYGFYKSTATAFNVTTTQVKYGSIQITTHGRPVFIICSGDMNPTASSCWMEYWILRDGVAITHDIAESHGNSWNTPFCISYLDCVAKGTYTYSIDFKMGSNTANLAEGGVLQQPDFSVFEI